MSQRVPSNELTFPFSLVVCSYSICVCRTVRGGSDVFSVFSDGSQSLFSDKLKTKTPCPARVRCGT